MSDTVNLRVQSHGCENSSVWVRSAEVIFFFNISLTPNTSMSFFRNISGILEDEIGNTEGKVLVLEGDFNALRPSNEHDLPRFAGKEFFEIAARMGLIALNIDGIPKFRRPG